MTSEAPDHEGRAAAMELVIGALMASYCRDGGARDDPALLRAMADYIERHMQVE